MLSHMVRLGVAAGAAIVFATAGAPPALAADCAELAKLKIDETDFLSATIVPRKAPLPEYCRVLGYVRPAVHFEFGFLPRTGTASSSWPAAVAFAGSWTATTWI